MKTMAFKIDGCKKIISDWHFICTCNTTSSIRLLWSKIIYMYKVFLSLLTHLFESSSLAIYIPHWRQTFLTARENFYNEKTLLWDNSKFQIYSNSWKSIRSWIHIHMSYDLTLLLIHSNTFFRKFASSSPPIRRKTNSVPTNIPLNVIPIMLKSFFMGVFFFNRV